MDMSYVVNQSAVTDGNNNPVQRVVDAAPWAYDAKQDAIRICGAEAIINNNLLRSLLYTYSRRYVYPMQELSGNVVNDYSENGFNAQYNGIILNKIGPTSAIDRAARFTGSSHVVIPKAACSVKGLAAFTYEAIIQVIDLGTAKHLYLEATEDDSSKSRFCVQLTAENKITVLIRSGLSTQTAVTLTTNAVLPEGPNHIAISVDIAANEVLVYFNGVNATTVGTVDFGTDVAIANTAPAGNILLGATQDVAGAVIPNYMGVMAYVALFSRKLAIAPILVHAKAAGLA